MANADITFIPDPDPESISSDVADFRGLLVTTQIPTRADGSLELGGIVEQSECTSERSRTPWSAPAAPWTAYCT